MAQRVIRKIKSAAIEQESDGLPVKKWKLLVVDDDPDIHQATKLAMYRFEFDQQPLEMVHAYSGREARRILADSKDIAVALVDVVMESDMAGLDLVRWIREVQCNPMIRLIIRTGQPGYAPEQFVINNYDIDDYKEKTELTRQKLYTSVRTAIKSYRDLLVIHNTKKGLEFILESSPLFFRLQSLENFFQGVLTQVVSLCHLGENGCMVADAGPGESVGAFIVIPDDHQMRFQCGIGKYADLQQIPETIRQRCLSMDPNDSSEWSQERSICLPMRLQNEQIGRIFIESSSLLSDEDRHLLQVMANQCAAAYDNSRLYLKLETLHHDLHQSYNHAIFMLATASEIKDIDTGNHLQRIRHFSEALAAQLNMKPEQIHLLGQASLLHDLGKLGIPDRIIRKPGRLTAEEFAVIQTHPGLAVKIIGHDVKFELARKIAYCHHEKWNGTGYPQGLKGEQIPFEARIVAVADVFDALISMRSYKEARPLSEAIEVIRAGQGTHFDPTVAHAMVELYERGVLSEIFSRFSARPEAVVRIEGCAQCRRGESSPEGF